MRLRGSALAQSRGGPRDPGGSPVRTLPTSGRLGPISDGTWAGAVRRSSAVRVTGWPNWRWSPRWPAARSCPANLPTVAAAVVIDRCAPDSVRAQLLPGLADGSLKAASFGLNIKVSMGGDYTATAQWPAVLGAPDADILVLAAGADLVIARADAAGVTVTPLDSMDTTRSVGAVSMRAAEIPADRVLQVRAGGPARCSDPGLGRGGQLSWATLDMAGEYAKVREQFGRTIGTFQAVKHHAANMLVEAGVGHPATQGSGRR